MSLRNKSGEENLNYILAIKNSLVTGMSCLVECINSIRCRCYVLWRLFVYKSQKFKVQCDIKGNLPFPISSMFKIPVTVLILLLFALILWTTKWFGSCDECKQFLWAKLKLCNYSVEIIKLALWCVQLFGFCVFNHQIHLDPVGRNPHNQAALYTIYPALILENLCALLSD